MILEDDGHGEFIFKTITMLTKKSIVFDPISPACKMHHVITRRLPVPALHLCVCDCLSKDRCAGDEQSHTTCIPPL